MSNDHFLNKYRKLSARADWHNYNGGAYFITICTQNRVHHFGEIENGEMRLSDIGKYAQQCIAAIPDHNPYANVPVFVVMPYHIHLVVFIDDNVGTVPPVETVHAPSLQSTQNPTQSTQSTQNPAQPSAPANRWKSATVDRQMQLISHRKHRLSCAIGNFKSAVTKFAHEKNVLFVWQPRFHDHIIRNTTELNRIAQYIDNNVANWDSETA